MTPTPTSQSTVRCFLSYAHDDQDALRFVDEFKKVLSHFAYSDRGRKLDIFVDHESIGWGDEWHQRIHESVRSAVVFIPLITVQYLTRPMCREELLLFFESAQELGVTELFLPVVVLGHRFIHEDSDDLVARRIASRQFKDLREAVIQGTESAEWRVRLLEIANSLVDAVEAAEGRLASQEYADEARRRPTGGVDELDEDAPDLQQLDDAATAGMNEVVEHFRSIERVLEEVKASVEPAAENLVSRTNARERTADVLRLANTLRPLGLELGRSGGELELRTAEVDRNLRDAWKMVRDYGGVEMRESFRSSITRATDSLSDIESVEGAISDFLTSLQPAEVLSVALRKSVRPMRKGATSIRAALSIMRTWRTLTED